LIGALLVIAGLAPPAGATSAWTVETSSAKTVTAKAYDPDFANAPFPDLAVTISQTTGLMAQGVAVSWTGGKPSRVPTNNEGGQNFLQLAQCWGDEPGSNGTRPDRTTCQYGGFNLPGASRWWNRSRAEEPLIPREDLPYTAPASGPLGALTSIPFRSATGVTIADVVGGVRIPGVDVNNNEFFTRYTTNEVSWAGSGADGAGSVSFELQTAQESPGLGCGAPVSGSGQTVKGASCWLVIIPRAEDDPFSSGIIRSGLFQETWKHHLAVKLEFRPLGLRCAIGAAERQLSGSELASEAVGRWQPAMCSSGKGMVFSLLTGPESDAVRAAVSTSTVPLALTARALSDAESDPLAYAPIALTGVSIGFAIDRSHGANEAPPEVVARERHAFESLKLTPRLLAKLLTASYRSALPTGAEKSHLGDNPWNLTFDPDFLAVNDPEWAYMVLEGVGLSDVLVPLGRSDTARLVWQYILADADATAFLAGKPDPWGMKVNPYYCTASACNATGEALTMPAEDFPKADPVEFEGSAVYDYADVVNQITWRPFSSSLDQSGYLVLRGDPLTLGGFDPLSTPPKYNRAARARVGLQKSMGLTSTSAAARYQVVQASLLNPAGAFVTPTTDTLLAAASAMTQDPNQMQVVGFDSRSEAAKAAKGAYPLAVPVYAAANPEMGDAAVRADYAAFIDYAATNGQQPGDLDGQLPPGYAPIPADWQKQAKAAAQLIKNGPPGGPTPTPTPAPTSTPTDPFQPMADSSLDNDAASTLGESELDSSNPNASGAAAAALRGGETPADPGVGALRAAVPAAGAVGLLAGFSLPLVSRIRRSP